MNDVESNFIKEVRGFHHIDSCIKSRTSVTEAIICNVNEFVKNVDDEYALLLYVETYQVKQVRAALQKRAWKTPREVIEDCEDNELI